MVPRKVTSKIIVHCSDTDGGSAEAIRKFHTAPVPEGRGWEDIGYHYVIDFSGLIEEGRDESLEGAHCEGQNYDSVGICLIGAGLMEFTAAQFQSLSQLMISLLSKYGLTWEAVFAHYEFPSAKIQGKSCPNINAELLREFMKEVKPV